MPDVDNVTAPTGAGAVYTGNSADPRNQIALALAAAATATNAVGASAASASAASASAASAAAVAANASQSADNAAAAANTATAASAAAESSVAEVPALRQELSAVASGHVGVQTLAALQAITNKPVQSIGEVLNDGTNNGLYSYQVGGWVKSTYDPVNQSKAYVDANRLFKPVALTAAADFNTLTAEGRTVVPTNAIAAACTNRPSATAGILDVALIGAGVLQKYRVFEFDLAYERQRLSGGTWTAWVQSASKDMVDTSAANTLQGAKDYADASTSASANAITDLVAAKNLYNPANNLNGFYIVSATGVVKNAAGWACVIGIAVTAGLQYTLSYTGTRQSGLAFYDMSGTLVGAVNTSATNPITITAPAGAVTAGFNINDASGSVPSSVQFEQSATATAYQAYAAPYRRLKDAALSSNAATTTQLAATNTQLATNTAQLATVQAQSASNSASITANTANLAAISTSTASVNLYNPANKIADKYVKTDGSISTSVGWGCSGKIAVTAGLQYTLSYIGSKRVGLAFYAASTDMVAVSSSYVGTDGSPLTVTAPAGANFVAFNLYSATITEPTNVQFELGATATTYKAFGSTITLNAQKVQEAMLSLDASNARLVLGTSSYIEAKIGTDTLKCGLAPFPTRNHDRSPVFNFVGESLNGTQYKPSSDDVAPLRALGTTIGANHGWAKSRLTVTGHTKTVADVGSVWSDGANQWVIVAVAVNAIDVVRRNADATLAAGVTLTHVSGATNTASFSGSASSEFALHPSVKNRTLVLTVDNVVIPITSATTGTYTYQDNVGFYESYEIIDHNSLVEWIIANNGADYTDYGGTGVILVKNSYQFDVRAACTIYTEVIALTSVVFADMMATQAQTINTGGNVRFYVPKALTFTYNSQSLNFAAIQDMAGVTFDGTRIDFTPSRVDASGQLADRMIMLNDLSGFASGYLPILAADPSVRRANASTKAMQISTAKKFYPSLIDSTSKTSLAAGESIVCASYRVPFVRNAARTSGYVVRSQLGDYLFCDWHTATTDSVPVPARLIGKQFTVVEKSSSVTVLSALASASVTFKTTGAGYAVLRFV